MNGNPQRVRFRLLPQSGGNRVPVISIDRIHAGDVQPDVELTP